MTLEKWIEERLDAASRTAEESAKIAPTSYGCWYDRGYEAALQAVFAELPKEVAFAEVSDDA